MSAVRSRFAAAALALLLPLPARSAAPAGTSARWHFVWEGTPALALSVLFRRSAEGDETRLLVEAATGRFVFVSRQTADSLDSLEAVTDVASGETFSRRLLLSGHASRPECAGVKEPDACLLFEGPGGKLAAGLSRFEGPQADPLRREALALLSGTLKERLLALAPVFPLSAEFRAYGADFLGLLWPQTYRRTWGPPSPGRRAAGCDFDAALGVPCTEADRETERRRFGGKPGG